jgi:hypothetical protein
VTAEATAQSRLGGAAPGQAAPGWPGRWRRPNLAWLAATGSLAFFATAQYCRHLYVDTYFDLYAGRYVAQHGIPERNVVTAMAHGKPWIDQQWLAQLIYYRTWQLGGYPAVVMLSVVLVCAGITVLGALMLRRGLSPLRMCAWTVAALAVSYGYATPRAQSFGYLLLPLVMWLILGADDRPRPRVRDWMSIPLLVMWANMHGSVLVGAGFVVLHAASRAWSAVGRRDWKGLASYLLLGSVAAASPICTPYGTHIVRYYGSLIGNPDLSGAGTEWTPPNPVSADSWAFFAVVIAVTVAVFVGFRRGSRPQREVAIFAVAALCIALVAYCVLAGEMLAGSSASRQPAAPFRQMLATALAACAVVAAIGLAREPATQYQTSIPSRAVTVAADIAARQPRLVVLSDQFCAVGLLWLHPDLLGRVAFDIRVEQYPRAGLAAMFDFIDARGPHWQRMLRGYDLVVVSRQMNPRLARALPRVLGWRVVYSDSSGVVLQRVR